MLASLTSTLASLLTDHGVLLVFAMLAVDAVLPVGGELPMLLSGALAAGAIGNGTTVLGAHVPAGLETFLVLACAGTLGYLVGSLAGWALGRRGGRSFVERHGRWLHLGPERMNQAEHWFERYGRWAVLWGRLTPLVRSLVSVPAGVLRAPLGPYALLTLLAATIGCFGLAGAGWALGDNWEELHHAFRVLDLAALLAAVAVVALIVHRFRRRGSQV